MYMALRHPVRWRSFHAAVSSSVVRPMAMFTPTRSEKDIWPRALRYHPLAASLLAAFSFSSRSCFACTAGQTSQRYHASVLYTWLLS